MHKSVNRRSVKHFDVVAPFHKLFINSSQPSLTMNETYFIAVLELWDMFDGGRVPIDHYVDNGTQLETAGPTYSFDIMYNTTLSVNISAHNFAGYSDPFPLEIEYEQGRAKIMHVLLCSMSILQILRSTLIP